MYPVAKINSMFNIENAITRAIAVENAIECKSIAFYVHGIMHIRQKIFKKKCLPATCSFTPYGNILYVNTSLYWSS